MSPDFAGIDQERFAVLVGPDQCFLCAVQHGDLQAVRLDLPEVAQVLAAHAGEFALQAGPVAVVVAEDELDGNGKSQVLDNYVKSCGSHSLFGLLIGFACNVSGMILLYSSTFFDRK